MNNEKQNNRYWKAAFLQWERSGAEAADKEDALWKKLQERLQPANIKRKKLLFAIAAMMVLFISAGVFVFQKNEKKPSTTNRDPINSKKRGSPSAVNNSIIFPNRNETAFVKKTVHKKEKAPLALVPEEAVTIIIKDTVIAKKEISVDSSAIATAAPKKKIRIVHINEWNKPKPPDYASLKEQWRVQQEQEIIYEENPARSIWPGRNKNNRPINYTQN